jgi:hypothetical protein
MPVRIRCRESLNGARLVVIAQAAGERIEEGRLAIRAGAEQEEERVLRCGTRERVPAHSLQEGDQLRVAAAHAIEERKPRPYGATRVRRRPGHLRYELVRAMWMNVSAPQVDDAGRGVEHPLVRVPLLRSCGEAPIGTS